MALRETWLSEQDQESDLQTGGFAAPYRLDWQTQLTGKPQGRSCVYMVTDPALQWPSERVFVCNVEVFSVSLPFYLSCEFP